MVCIWTYRWTVTKSLRDICNKQTPAISSTYYSLMR